jgi:hypothetical protein
VMSRNIYQVTWYNTIFEEKEEIMTTLDYVNVLSCRAHANTEKCNQARISRIARTDLSHETKESET